MMDGQSGRMQQVADQCSFDAGDGREQTTSGRRPAARHTLLAGDRIQPATCPDGLPYLSLRTVDGCVVDEQGQARVLELVDLLLHRHAGERLDPFVDDLLTNGIPVEHIYLRVFQPAARRLGILWAEDICSFVDVTLSMALLQGSFRRLAPNFLRHGRPSVGMKSVYLTTPSRDQHTFGLTMVAEFFRRGGWAVSSVVSGDVDGLAARLKGERNAIVGFSASRTDQLSELAATIRRLRRLGRDRIAGIVVGGPLFFTHPDSAREIGADAIGLDARQALAEAENLVAAAGDCW